MSLCDAQAVVFWGILLDPKGNDRYENILNKEAEEADRIATALHALHVNLDSVVDNRETTYYYLAVRDSILSTYDGEPTMIQYEEFATQTHWISRLVRAAALFDIPLEKVVPSWYIAASIH